MNPVPLLIVILLTLSFETVFIGQDVNVELEPFKMKVDTTQQSCTFGDFPCGIANAFRPVLGFIATVINGVEFVGGLIAFRVPGAPTWVQAIFGGSISTALIWCLVELLRGKGS